MTAVHTYRWLEENPCAESVGPELYRQAQKQTNKKHSVMSKQKRIMAKGKVMDVKREAKSGRKGFVRISDHSERPNVQTPDNDLQKIDNQDDVQKSVGQRKNLKKGEEVNFGQTVIRNLPQLQTVLQTIDSLDEQKKVGQRRKRSRRLM